MRSPRAHPLPAARRRRVRWSAPAPQGLLGGGRDQGLDSTGLGTTRASVTAQRRVEHSRRLGRGYGTRRNGMQDDPSDRQVHLVPAKMVSRRAIVALTAKLVGGATLSLVAGTRLAQVAADQDAGATIQAAISPPPSVATSAAASGGGGTPEAGGMVVPPASSTKG